MKNPSGKFVHAIREETVSDLAFLAERFDVVWLSDFQRKLVLDTIERFNKYKMSTVLSYRQELVITNAAKRAKERLASNCEKKGL